MKRSKKNKRKLTAIVALLIVFMFGIGYAVLTQKLQIGGNVNYGTIKWNVGFTEMKDYSEEYIEYNRNKFPTMDMTQFVYTPKATTSISEDKKTVSFSCDVGQSTKMIMCVAVGTIQNDSTFDVEVESITITSEDHEKYDQAISALNASVSTKWFTSFDDQSKVTVGDVIPAGETKQVLISYSVGDLTTENVEIVSGLQLDFDVNINFIEKSATE